MTTTNDIISTLSGKTKTLGWDAVVAYDRERINHLLQQQYVSKLATGTHFPPVTWSNSGESLRFENLTLGTPLISFENAAIEKASATVFMEFIDGSITELQTLKSLSQVTRHTRLRPGMGYGLKMNVDLTVGTGTVGQEGMVVIDFKSQSISVEGINETSAEVVQYFSNWLQNNNVTYEVGQISMAALGTSLTPTSFIIRTQPASDASKTGNGAVLLFVATNNHSAGTPPGNSYPWLIPDTHSSAILVSNRLVLENYVKPTLDKMLDTGSWALTRGVNADDAAYYLQASADATINTPYIYVNEIEAAYWTGNYTTAGASHSKIFEDYVYSLKNAKCSLNGKFLTITYDETETYKQRFGMFYPASLPTGVYTRWHSGNVPTTIAGNVNYALDVDSSSEAISISLLENNSQVNSDFTALSSYQNDTIIKRLNNLVSERLQISNAILTLVPFNDINVFAVNHILFPAQNINTLQAAYAPGDLVIFGDIAPALTSLVVEPLTTTLPVGGRVQFTSNSSRTVTWSLSPANAGTISASGLYQAPVTLDGRSMPVTVTATDAGGATASSHITVVPSSLIVSPAFVLIDETNLQNVQLTVTALGGNTLTGWTLEASADGLEGTISPGGLYSPPDMYPDSYPHGYTFVTATATASDGGTARALIMLRGEETQATFMVTPPLVSSLSLGSTQDFSADIVVRDYPDTWSHYPPVGSLSSPVKVGSTYSVTYTAPDTLSGDDLVVIVAEDSEYAQYAGHAIIDIADQEQDAWSRIEGVSTLRVSTESGGGSAQLYRNNAHQAAIVVQFSGYQLVNGIPQEVSVSMEDILPHIQLVDYVTGEALPHESGDGWFWTTQENEFERLPSGARLDDPQSRAADSLVFYVSCNSGALDASKSIAVSVTLADGRVISTASNASAGFNSAVTLTPLAAIDYSDPASIRMVQSSQVTVLDSLPWAEHPVNSGTFTVREDTCQIKADKFILQPATDGISRFHSFQFIHDKVMNYDVSRTFFAWDSNPVESTFRCLDDNQGLQCSVLGRTGEEGDGTANIWFAGEQTALTEGQIYFSSEGSERLLRVTIPAFSEDNSSAGFPHFLLLKVVTKEPASKPYNWSTVSNPVTLRMTDIFGNSGAVTVRWDEEDNYDIPHLS